MPEMLKFELVSPTRLMKSELVEMVVVPCTEGDIGVLPGHSPLIATVRPGVIDIHEGGKVTESIFVAGGFAEVGPEGCTVLAEEAVAVADIQRAAVDARKTKAKEALAGAGSDKERQAAEADVRVADAMLDAIERKTKH